MITIVRIEIIVLIIVTKIKIMTTSIIIKIMIIVIPTIVITVRHIANISRLTREVDVNIVFLIVHSAKKMLFKSGFISVYVLCCF